MSTRSQRILWTDLAPAQPASQPDPRSIGVGATQCAAGAFCRETVVYIGAQGLAWCERHVPADARMNAEERRKILARRGEPEPHNPRWCSCEVCVAAMAEERVV